MDLRLPAVAGPNQSSPHANAHGHAHRWPHAQSDRDRHRDGKTVTPTATVTPTPTLTPSSTPDPSLIDVTLNEFMPDPASDWNGDGTATQDDEYIELFNAGPAPVDLGGWMLDDVDDSQNRVRSFFAPDGSRPFVIPAGTVVDPGGFVLFFRSETDVTLNNDGDWVRLLRPDAVVAETFEYTSSRDDQAYSKTLDGGDEWTRSYPPSPGRSNTLGGTPTPSPTVTPRATRTPTPSPTPAGTPQPLPTGVSLNEVMPWPASDWNGDGQVDSDDEYIETLQRRRPGGGPGRLETGRQRGERPKQNSAVLTSSRRARSCLQRASCFSLAARPTLG